MNTLPALALLVLVGCVDSFDSPTEINAPRLLGGRLEVEGDAARATPRPGERVTLSWWLVAPEEVPEASHGFLACAAPPGATAPVCAGEPFEITISPVPSTDTPVFSFTVPEETASVLVQGAFCVGGSPVLSPEDGRVRCEGDGAEIIPVVRYVTVATEEASPLNQHPTWDGAEVRVGDVPLLSSAPEESFGEPCRETAEGLGLPVLTREGKKRKVTVTPAAEAREDFTNAEGDAAREALELSQFVTAKELERQFSFIDDTQPSAEFDWTLPKNADIPADGLLVRFFFVLRDGREGSALLERALCLLPEPPAE